MLLFLYFVPGKIKLDYYYSPVNPVLTALAKY